MATPPPLTTSRAVGPAATDTRDRKPAARPKLVQSPVSPSRLPRRPVIAMRVPAQPRLLGLRRPDRAQTRLDRHPRGPPDGPNSRSTCPLPTHIATDLAQPRHQLIKRAAGGKAALKPASLRPIPHRPTTANIDLKGLLVHVRSGSPTRDPAAEHRHHRDPMRSHPRLLEAATPGSGHRTIGPLTGGMTTMPSSAAAARGRSYVAMTVTPAAANSVIPSRQGARPPLLVGDPFVARGLGRVESRRMRMRSSRPPTPRCGHLPRRAPRYRLPCTGWSSSWR